MDKLEAVQRVLRFSESVRNWCEKDEKVFFDDFDNENIMNYDVGGHGELADTIIEKGIEEGFIDEDDWIKKLLLCKSVFPKNYWLKNFSNVFFPSPKMHSPSPSSKSSKSKLLRT